MRMSERLRQAVGGGCRFSARAGGERTSAASSRRAREDAHRRVMVAGARHQPRVVRNPPRMNRRPTPSCPCTHEGEPMSGRRTILITAVVAASLLLGLGAPASADSPPGPGRQGHDDRRPGGIGTTRPARRPDVCGDPDAVGTAHIVVSPAADRVCFRLKWSGIDGAVWGAHIHGPATTTQAAPIRVAVPDADARSGR